MEYSQVILEMLERIKTLEAKVKELEDANRQKDIVPISVDMGSISRKYRPLAEYLVRSGEPIITLSHEQIEDILGFSLPKTAQNYTPSFWANTRTHSYASSWLGVGYKTRLGCGHGIVQFVRQAQIPVE